MQDVIDREEMNQFMKPSRQQEQPKKEAAQKGFVVSGAPWDTNSTEDFPTIGGGAAPAANGGSRVGPWGRRH